jgi:hypothetical protein
LESPRPTITTPENAQLLAAENHWKTGRFFIGIPFAKRWANLRTTAESAENAEGKSRVLFVVLCVLGALCGVFKKS